MFVYDPKKNVANKAKHGLSLEDATKLWNMDHVIIPAKNMAGEDRYLILGIISKKVYAAVFIYRNDCIRIISCHRADKKLERYYHEKIK